MFSSSPRTSSNTPAGAREVDGAEPGRSTDRALWPQLRNRTAQDRRPNCGRRYNATETRRTVAHFVSSVRLAVSEVRRVWIKCHAPFQIVRCRPVIRFQFEANNVEHGCTVIHTAGEVSSAIESIARNETWQQSLDSAPEGPPLGNMITRSQPYAAGPPHPATESASSN